jgi:hypothetical protein
MSELKTYTQEELDKALSEKTDGIRAELTTIRKEKKDIETQFKSISDDFEKFKSEQTKTKSEEEKKQLESQGKYDEALKKYHDETQKVIENKDKTIAELKAQVTKFRVDNEIMGSAGDAINPNQIVTLLKSEYQFTEHVNGQVEILHIDGSPVLNKDTGKPVNIKEMTAIYLSENQHLVKATGGGGSGTRGGGQGTGGNTFDTQFRAAIESGDQKEIVKLKTQRMREMSLTTVPLDITKLQKVKT